MSAAERFFDTNVLLYLLSGDAGRADRAEAVVAAGGVISVQVLNEFAAVSHRKLRMPIAEVREVLATLRAVCPIEPLTEQTHDRGMAIAGKYRLSVYDAMIVAAALQAGCTALVSEDLQAGQVFESSLVVENLFAA